MPTLKRSEDALRESTRQLKFTLNIVKRLQCLSTLCVREENLRATLDKILEAAIFLMHANKGNIQLLDAHTGTLTIVAQRGFKRPFLDFWSLVHKNEGTCGAVIAHRRQTLVEDVSKSPIFSDKPTLNVMLQAKVRAVLSTPLYSRSRELLGVLSVHYNTPTKPDKWVFPMLTLLTGQASDIIERVTTEQALHESYDERERLNQDLHDSILQSIYAVGMGLEVTKRGMPTDKVTRLNNAIAQLNAVAHEVRSFITPKPMLPTPIRNMTQMLQAARNIFTTATGHDIGLQLDPDLAKAIQPKHVPRIILLIKEALSNSVRHARATHCSVILRWFRGKIRLEIFDNGVGFRVSRRREAGMGLATMQARVQDLGGRLSIISRPRCGTRVVCTLPSSLLVPGAG